MKSRVSYLGVGEASAWIAGKLANEGLLVSEEVVSGVLNAETAFMAMIGLAKPGDASTVQAGYIRRDAAWVEDRGGSPHPEAEEGGEIGKATAEEKG